MSTDVVGAEQNLTAQGTVVASMTGISRITGFVRDVVFSGVFGATGAADAFFVAFRIPNFFRRLFAEGAFAQAFVPVLAEYRKDGMRPSLDAFVRAVAGDFMLVLTSFSVLGVVGAPLLVLLFAPGFWDDAKQTALAVEMVRITFPYLAFVSLTAFAGALLNSFHRYAVPAFTPVLLNVVLVLAALVVAPRFDEPVIALAWGVLAAGVVQFVFQLPALKRLELLHKPRLDWRDPGIRKVGKLLVPAVFAASVNQINGLVGTILASLLATGSISWLYYSDRLMELPIGLVAIALGTVLLPNLSRLHSTGDAERFNETLDWGVRMGILLGLPAAAALYALSTPLVATIFHRGALTAFDVAMSATALRAFAVGLLPLVLVKIVAPGYFARQDTSTPFRYAAVSVMVNVGVSLAVFSWMGHVGLAYATSVAAVANCYLLIRGLIHLRVYRPTRRLGRVCAAAVTAAAGMIAITALLDPAGGYWVQVGEWARIGQLALIIAAGLAAYVVLLIAFGLRPVDFRHRV